MTSEVSIPTGKVFVTGGSGHVGANLVRRLLEDGHEVRCLVEPKANNRGLEGLDVELLEGDLRDADRMRKAVDGCVRVFHVAAKISTLNATPAERREMYEINVLGTRNVMRASLEAGVARAVLTSSFSSVGYNLDDPTKPSNEELPFYPFAVALPYSHTKTLAELETLKCVVDGLDAVIATSCACIGPHDYLPSRIGRTAIDYANGRLRAYVNGGFPFVSYRDLIDGHILAMEKGQTGQKYIFATEYHMLSDMVQWWSESLDKPPVRFKVPMSVMRPLTSVYYQTLTKLFPESPQRFTPGALEILSLHRRADVSKSVSELGYQPTSVRAAARDALEFYIREGMMPGKVVDTAS